MDIIKKSLVRISEPNIFESDIPIIGKTKTIFNMLDPTIFPMTRFPFFCFKALSKTSKFFIVKFDA